MTATADATENGVGHSLMRIGCQFEVAAAVDTHAIVIVEPHETERSRIADEEFIAPVETPTTVYRDLFGNLCRRLTLPTGRSGFGYFATVTYDPEFEAVDEHAVQQPPADLPNEVLVYLLPSRFCPSDDLAPHAFQTFGHLPGGWDRTDRIAGWVHDHVGFEYGSASPTKTAADVLRDGQGVCRDFAHLAISLCRALHVPARYVVGYIPDIGVTDPGTPMDFCAWVEAYLGNRWCTFDPRNHGERRVGRTVIARGRDAADVAMTTTFGRVDLVSMTVVAESAD